MVLFECTEQAALENNFTHQQVISNCERMVQGCQSTKWPWAVGGEDLVLPTDVGIPIGDGARWYALQVHYYNPRMQTGEAATLRTLNHTMFFYDFLRRCESRRVCEREFTGPSILHV